MMLIDCPWCGPRNATEFHHHGPATARPSPDQADPTTWRRYLYQRPNPLGEVEETWYHSAGCRRFLTVRRNTLSNENRSVRGGK